MRDLHTIGRSTEDPWLRTLIEDCTASAVKHPVVTSRARLLALATAQGVRVPPSVALPDLRALQRWMEDHPTPWVMKADGSWSGFGVRIINDAAEAEAAFTQLSQRASLRFALRESILEGNHFGYRPWLRHDRPALSAQGFVDGWPANIGVACWKGEVLASTCAEAVATETATGPSTVARIIQNAEMTEAARRIVSALGLSGLIGFDFMIEAATGAAYLIEMNPRSTPICALRLGAGRDLTEALLARRMGRPVRERAPRTERDIVVAFPETWMLDPSNTFLRDGFHDVPWEQPALVRRLMQAERRERFWIFRTLRRVLRRG
ncbi:MAG: ATP-grasp domain-containing protein, partial [Rhodospirillales bacterium]|nr:ATP-grasp domain-containing protein [Acetobacter sp.]